MRKLAKVGISILIAFVGFIGFAFVVSAIYPEEANYTINPDGSKHYNVGISDEIKISDSMH